MATTTAQQPAGGDQSALCGPQRVATMRQQPASCQEAATVSLKRKCPSPAHALQSSVLDLDSGSRASGDSECFALDPAAFSQDASPESQQQLSFRPRTPGNAALGKRRRLSLGSCASGSASLGSAGSCGPTPPGAAGQPDDASPESAHLLRIPSVPPPIAALPAAGAAAACEQASCGSCQLFDIPAADPVVPQPCSGDAAPLQQFALPCGQELLQQQAAAQQAHHQQLLAAQQQQQLQQQRAAQHAVASMAMLRANALSRCATMPPAYRQPQQQAQAQLPQLPGGMSWVPAYALPALTRLRRSTSDNGAAAAGAAMARLSAAAYGQPSGVQPFSELLAEAERRRAIPQLQALRASHSVAASHHASALPAQVAAASAATAAPFAFAAAGLQTRSAHAAYSQRVSAHPAAPVFSFCPRVGVPQVAAPQHSVAYAQQQSAAPPTIQQSAQPTPKAAAPTQRRWPPAGAPGGAGGAPQLLARWGRALPLHRGETLLLALHMWERLQPRVKPQELLRKGCPQPWQAALLGCLWVAAKLEERRRGLPSASKIGELLGLDRKVVAGVELYVMEALEWAPTAGWQSRRRDFRA